VETVRPEIEARGHSVSISRPPERIVVEGDSSRLEQVVVNLLNNAARYTNTGGHIDLMLERQGDQVVFRICDDGVGIAADVLPQIFDLFVRASPIRDDTQGGLGIGLAVVRDLIALHGGRVEAKSGGLGRGAEFIVHLPCLDGEGHHEAGTSFLESRDDERRARVLVVEDNVDSAEALMMLLEMFGHEARTAYDGQTALEVASTYAPDLMIIDLGLPGIDGCEVARRVRSKPEFRDTALVAVTGFGQDSDRERALAAGFDHHLTKPVEPARLRRLIARLTGSTALRGA
jgi:CheY-like chemotaxis protein